MLSSILTWLLSIGPALAAQQIQGGGATPAPSAPAGGVEGAASPVAGPMGSCGEGGGGTFSLFWIAAIMIVFYFLLIRPQSKRAKEHQGFVGGLKKGDNVVMNAGIYGTIVGVSENVVTLEISDKVRIRVAKSQIAGYAKNADKALEQAEKR